MEPKVDNHIFPNLQLEWHYFFTFFLQTFQLNLMACILRTSPEISAQNCCTLRQKSHARQPNPKSKHAY